MDARQSLSGSDLAALGVLLWGLPPRQEKRRVAQLDFRRDASAGPVEYALRAEIAKPEQASHRSGPAKALNQFGVRV